MNVEQYYKNILYISISDAFYKRVGDDAERQQCFEMYVNKTLRRGK